MAEGEATRKGEEHSGNFEKERDVVQLFCLFKAQLS